MSFPFLCARKSASLRVAQARALSQLASERWVERLASHMNKIRDCLLIGELLANVVTERVHRPLKLRRARGVVPNVPNIERGALIPCVRVRDGDVDVFATMPLNADLRTL